MSKNLLPIAIIIAGILVAGVLFYTSTTNQEKAEDEGQEFLSPQAAAEKLIQYIKGNLPEEVDVSLVNVVEENGVYKLTVEVTQGEQGEEADLFVTKDGKFFFDRAYELDASEEDVEAPSTEVPKTDKPDVKLFVMSYCPYGLQAQKMFLPAYDLLKDKTDMGVYFVNYIMHDKDEIDENLNQYCIQKEESTKYSKYLNCFVLEDDYEKCASQAGIDKVKIDTCVSSTDNEFNITAKYNDKNTWLNGTYPVFGVHDELNKKYQVGGSPTVVINDTIVSVGSRSPENFKKVICQAFNSPPEECNQVLSNVAASPGIGGGTGSSSGGSCQ